jgi:uncharacterized membrane protein YjgN (DUF898 family)
MDTTIESEIAAPHVQDEAPEPHELALAFTGSGKEYFRIWIVNLLLTVATLGIYSAWAKVRRLQYFYRSTQLAGATFDFHGNPTAILKGRLIAVALLAGYHYAFGFSITAGVIIAAILILGLPFLMRSALRFRLASTSYRGLSFGFGGSLAGAYLVYLPPVVTVLLPGAILSIDPQNPFAAAAGVLYVAWPEMHGLMKRYQHRNLRYGNQHARFEVSARRFYGPYFRAGLFASGCVIVTAVLAGAVTVGLEKTSIRFLEMNPVTSGLITAAFSGYLFFMMAGPYLQVRINNLAWSNTSLPGVTIRSAMKARAMMRLQLANALLTLLTLGLYRPFAVVRVYRYRLAHITLEADGQFEHIVAAAAQPVDGTAGDGAADFIGVDISW